MHQTAGGQFPQVRYAFVDGMVDLEVLTLHIGVALSAVVEPDEVDPDVVGRAFADQEGIGPRCRRPRQSGPRWPASAYRQAWRRTATPGCGRTRLARPRWFPASSFCAGRNRPGNARTARAGSLCQQSAAHRPRTLGSSLAVLPLPPCVRRGAESTSLRAARHERSSYHYVLEIFFTNRTSSTRQMIASELSMATLRDRHVRPVVTIGFTRVRLVAHR